ncbi:MAG: hypothetical protein COA43_02185 [Robiginitomaculum sp.]|nr:MAG: hypothetical protein COA43_02185 [Robiginitomaculum sp.]
MRQKQAHTRYMKIFAPAMLVYVIGILTVVYLREHTEVARTVLIALSLVPAVSMIVWMWGHMRYITEIDEYLRAQQVKSIMFGLAAIMSFATFWGLIELLVDLPPVPIFYVVPGFYLIQGLSFAIACRLGRNEESE